MTLSVVRLGARCIAAGVGMVPQLTGRAPPAYGLEVLPVGLLRGRGFVFLTGGQRARARLEGHDCGG
jgi:hypothetical protein